MALTQVSRGLLSTSIVDNGNATAITIDSSENVGIGTGSPSSDISASSTVLEIADSNVASLALNNTTQSTKFEIASLDVSGGALSIRDNNSERLRIDSSGKIGIGTSSPTSAYSEPALHIHAAVNGAEIHLTDGSTGATAADGLSVFQYGPDGYIWERESGNLRFGTAATERLRIDSSGNVGIGITPENSSGTWRNLQFGGGNLAFRSSGANDAMIGTGYLFKTDNSEVYKNAEAVSRLFFDNSSMIFQQAASGTAGTTISWSEAMRIDTSGNLLVGKTAVSLGVVGVEVKSFGEVRATASGAQALQLNRLSTDGTIADFRKDGTTVGSIGAAQNSTYIGGSGNGAIYFNSQVDVRPWNKSTQANLDNIMDLGSSSSRWDDIYATNGTIQTSDRNEKQDIEALSDAEQRVAVATKGLLRKFRWISSVEENGDDARIHFGIIAQDLQDAFTAEGLDAGRYAMFISSTWTDDDGNEQTRLGVRYSELLAFIISAI